MGQLDEELEHMQAAVLRMHHQNVELTRERNALKQVLEALRGGEEGDDEDAATETGDGGGQDESMGDADTDDHAGEDYRETRDSAVDMERHPSEEQNGEAAEHSAE